MTYRKAKKLHNEDEVTIKETGKVVNVLRVYEPNPMSMIYRHIILIECDDGNTYYHSEIK